MSHKIVWAVLFCWVLSSRAADDTNGAETVSQQVASGTTAANVANSCPADGNCAAQQTETGGNGAQTKGNDTLSSSSSSSSSNATEAGTDQGDEEPLKCPPLLQPHDIQFIVINLDRSKERRKTMEQTFERLNLPPFVRIPGVLYDEKDEPTYEVKRLTKYLKPADFGCALAHYRAWQHVASSDNEWWVILEDDALLLDDIDYTSADAWPLVPEDADIVLLRAATILQSKPICDKTIVRRTTWGYGMVGYLLNRRGARRMMETSQQGFRAPIDGHIWYHNQTICSMPKNFVDHERCVRPCKNSIRTWLNGDIDEEPND